MNKVVMVGLVVLSGMATSCKSVPGSVAAALAWTAVAATTSAANRATGGCFSYCVEGTRCNPNTGLCQRLPCDGQCSAKEQCVDVGRREQCVAREKNPPLRLVRPAGIRSSTVAPPAPTEP